MHRDDSRAVRGISAFVLGAVGVAGVALVGGCSSGSSAPPHSSSSSAGGTSAAAASGSPTAPGPGPAPSTVPPGSASTTASTTGTASTAVARSSAPPASPTHRPTTLPLVSSSPPPGNLSPVASTPATTAPPTPIGSPAPAGGVLVRIVAVRPVTTSGSGPGEISGQPAVAFTVRVTNRSRAVVPVNTVAVTAAYGAAGTPAVSSDGPPSSPLVGAVAPGASAEGTWVFAIPTAQRSRVSVLVGVAAGDPTLVFSGPVG